jgi:hypothetical protein
MNAELTARQRLDEAERESKSYVSCEDQFREIHRDTAKRIWPGGTVLRCTRCGRTQTASIGELAKYLAGGWPQCHRETMRIGDPLGN